MSKLEGPRDGKDRWSIVSAFRQRKEKQGRSGESDSSIWCHVVIVVKNVCQWPCINKILLGKQVVTSYKDK